MLECFTFNILESFLSNGHTFTKRILLKITIAPSKTRITILGDFNINMGLDSFSAPDSSPTQTFHDFCRFNRLNPCVWKPTRITKTSATVIDNIREQPESQCQQPWTAGCPLPPPSASTAALRRHHTHQPYRGRQRRLSHL